MNLTPILAMTLLETAGGLVTEFVANALTRGTLLFVLAYVACRWVRRFSAADRHGVWALALTASALTSAAMAWHHLPGRSHMAVPLLVESPSPSADPTLTIETLTSATLGSPISEPTQGIEEVTVTPTNSRFMDAWSLPIQPPVTSFVAFVWLVGFLGVLAHGVMGHVGLARLRRATTSIRDPEWLSLMDKLRRTHGIGHPIDLRQGPMIRVPMVFGARSPVVLLPESSRDWTGERRLAVLLHELGHVRRRDCLVQDIATLAVAILWFHPLAWLARTRLRMEREFACDDTVMLMGFKPSDYAEHLLDLAGKAHPAILPSAVAMARTWHLPDRVRAILDPVRPRRSCVSRGSLAVAMGLVFVACLLPRILAVQAPNTVEESPKATPGILALEVPPTANPEPLVSLGDLEPEVIRRLRATLALPNAEPLASLASRESEGIRRLRATLKLQQEHVLELERNLERTHGTRHLPTHMDSNPPENAELQSNLGHLEQLRAELRSLIVRLVSQRDRITSLPNANLTGVLLSVYPEDKLLQHLAVARLDARVQYESSISVLGEAHPEVKKASKVMELTEKELTDRVEGILRGMTIMIEAHQAVLDHLDKAIQSEVDRNTAIRAYLKEERDVNNARIMLDVLTRKLAQEVFDAHVSRTASATNAVLMP